MFLFIPALLDVLFAIMDFAIFTSSASAEAVQLRESLVARDDVWCITITDSCVPIIEEEANREHGERPGEANYTAFTISACVGIPLLVILYGWCAICVRR